MTLAVEEYRALRATIASRGTARMLLLPFTVATWAALSAAVLLYGSPPMGALLSLAVLTAGFEATRALHIGVERIGRFLQVFYEEPEAGDAATRAQWEISAMAGGPGLPGGGVDPLFTVLFSCTAILNMAMALAPGPSPVETAAIGVLHIGFLVRVVRTRVAAGSERAKDLAHYRALRDKMLT